MIVRSGSSFGSRANGSWSRPHRLTAQRTTAAARSQSGHPNGGRDVTILSPPCPRRGSLHEPSLHCQPAAMNGAGVITMPQQPALPRGSRPRLTAGRPQ
jgi:hypothetical protein